MTPCAYLATIRARRNGTHRRAQGLDSGSSAGRREPLIRRHPEPFPAGMGGEGRWPASSDRRDHAAAAGPPRETGRRSGAGRLEPHSRDDPARNWGEAGHGRTRGISSTASWWATPLPHGKRPAMMEEGKRVLKGRAQERRVKRPTLSFRPSKPHHPAQRRRRSRASRPRPPSRAAVGSGTALTSARVVAIVRLSKLWEAEPL